jgi:transaldolase
MIKIFADGADLKSILELNENPLISGFTTNPSLIRKAGVENYEKFAKEVLSHIKDKPVSLEVISDDLDEMKKQARKIASWGGNNVYVKIPITNTQGISTCPIIAELSTEGIKVNVTAIFTLTQIEKTISALNGNTGIVSIFAGRIEDTGIDAAPFFWWVHKKKLIETPNIELLWASTRELFSIKKAEECGANIITVGHDLLKKMSLFGKDLEEYSLETVKQFYNDAQESGYHL